MNFDDDGYDDGDDHDAPGKVRREDPITSYLAAYDAGAVTALQRQTLEAMRFADQYPERCMTSFDVARHHDRHDARDSFSPSVSQLNQDGLLIWVKARPCMNAAGKMRKMNGFRLRKEGDPEFVFPPGKTRLQRMLISWRKLGVEDREEFLVHCDLPIVAEMAWCLWERMTAEEQRAFRNFQEDYR